MTVSELITAPQAMPGDLLVTISDWQTGNPDPDFSIEVVTATRRVYNPGQLDEHIRLEFGDTRDQRRYVRHDPPALLDVLMIS